MQRVSCGISGSEYRERSVGWDKLSIGQPWLDIISILNQGLGPRPVHLQAIKEGLLKDRSNVIISAPTNAGKSLLGWLVLLEAVSAGKRAILLEPLRAIAQEKTEQMRLLADALTEVLGKKIKVIISTGDYRLETETFASPAPQDGEIIIATPERMEAIIRNSANAPWLGSIGAVCVDEAHLLSSPRRGPTLDFVITSLLTLPQHPRIIFLSATLGNNGDIEKWLAPCQTVVSSERVPPLYKEVVLIDREEDSNEIIANLVRETLREKESKVLIFVYQTSSTEHLAKYLAQQIPDLSEANQVLAYHSKMSGMERQRVSEFYLGDTCRCLVATTALGLGVNLPATHVFVRDNTFPGVGPLSSSELFQMMGRAGRGNIAGKAAVLVKPSDSWGGQELAEVLRDEVMPSLQSPFASQAETKQDIKNVTMQVAGYIAGILSRSSDGIPEADLERFLSRSWSGKYIIEHLDTALEWLCDPWNSLAYQDDSQVYHLTVLGKRACKSSLPLEVAAGTGRIIRDLLTLSPEDHLLRQWKPMDSLILMHLLSGRSPSLRLFSSKLVDQVDGWMERTPDKIPLLYRWFAGSETGSRAKEIIATLDIAPSATSKKKKDWARQVAYVAMVNSIILYDLSQGILPVDLERQWRVKNLEGIEERWRDEYIWLLSGLADIFELRCFYYHLREECSASPDRIKRVKNILRDLQLQTIHLREQIKYCSALGPMVLAIKKKKQNKKGQSVGVATLRTLEGAGIKQPKDLRGKTVDELVELGVRRDLAKQVWSYVNGGG